LYNPEQVTVDTGYRRQWNAYRKREVLATLPQICFVLMMVINALHKFAIKSRFTVFVITWALLSSLAAVPMFQFRCPRCKKRFFRPAARNVFLIKECVHCHLPKWASGDPGDSVYIDGLKRQNATRFF
jgi:hypothetical protein